MYRQFGLALSAVLLCAPAATAGTPPASSPVAASYFPADEEIRRLLRLHVDSGEAKGLAVGLLEPDGRRRVITYGSAGDGVRPLDAKSVFEIGSLTKTFTGALLADMARRGEVSLEDPVSKYLPQSVRVPMRGNKPVTLLDLATHMSGLPRSAAGYVPSDPSNPYAGYGAKELYAFLNSYEGKANEVTQPVYSNIGFALLGLALTRAAHAQSFADLLSSRILKPLRMASTAYGRPANMRAWLTVGHDRNGRPVPYWDVDVMAGAGGLNSSMEDMLSYLDANLGKPRSILENEMRAAQKAYRPGPNDTGLGLAWSSHKRNGMTILAHSGATAGYRTFLALAPDRNAGVIVMANSGSFLGADNIAEALLTGGGQPQFDLPAAALAEYVGTYRLRAGFDLVLAAEDGKLVAQATGQPKLEFEAEAKDRFRAKLLEARLVFSRDRTGAVTGLVLQQHGREIPAPKVAR